MNLFIRVDLCFILFHLNYIFCAEPRPLFTDLEVKPVIEPWIQDLLQPDESLQYGKILLRPLAFSYFKTNPEEGAPKVKTKRNHPQIKKLDTKRILIPKKKINETDLHDDEEGFEETPDDDYEDDIQNESTENKDQNSEYTQKVPVSLSLNPIVVLSEDDVDEDYDSTEDESKETVQIAQNATISGDLKVSSSDHSKEKKPVDTKYESGKGKEAELHHYEEHTDKGDKGHESKHEDFKNKKGHHNKEEHKYDEKDGGGKEEKHNHEDDYHGEHGKSEKGEKGAKFEESGEHKKGHSTKGSHNVHKKDEYEKKEEFYDEDLEEFDFDKAGGYFEENDFDKGGHEKKYHNDEGHHQDHYGGKKHYEHGNSFKEDKHHKDDSGNDSHHGHHSKYGKKGGHHGHKKWSYKH